MKKVDANMIFTRDNGKYCGTDIIKYPYHIRDIRIMGIGTSQSVQIDSKQIIRTALITATEKVIHWCYL